MFSGRILLIFFPLFPLFPLSSLSLESSSSSPSHYDFSLDALKSFYPGKRVKEIQKKHGKGDVLGRQENLTLMRFYVAYHYYRFPVFVQVEVGKGKVWDSFARLPAFFHHDTFHQSLIKRLGKQDEFFHREDSSLYIWKNREGGIDLIYEGICTLTCFPMYLYLSRDSKSPSLIRQMTDLPPL